jgi:myosin heavy subunit
MFLILSLVLNMGNIDIEEGEDDGAVVQGSQDELKRTAVSFTK